MGKLCRARGRIFLVERLKSHGGGGVERWRCEDL